MKSIYLIICLGLCGLFQIWEYCTSPYTWGIPRLYLATRVVKASQLLQVKIMSGSGDLLGDIPLTHYPESQGGRLFGQKDNQNNLSRRDSVNSTSQTVKPLIVRCYHRTSLHTYNLLTLIKLPTNKIHLRRDWQMVLPPLIISPHSLV